jgi:asparagine synthase (glutamine-hydrolysing)
MRVLLDGFDGDSAVHHGDSYLAEIARAGDWERFASEARAISRHEGLASLPSLIDQYGSPYLTELALSGKFGTFAREAHGFARAFGLNRRKVYWHCAIAPGFLAPMRRLTGQLAQRGGARNGVGRMIQRGFARRIGLAERLNAFAGNRPGTVSNAREEHVAILSSGLLPYAFECLDKASMAYGIEGRHPYADRRLVELCVSMPAQQKLHQGWTRMVVRRALSDVLPHEIAWRGGKTVNSPAVSAAFDKVKTTVLRDAIIDAPGSLGAYVDLRELREIYRRYLDGGGLQDELLLWQSATLALWLRHTGLGG